MLDFEIQISFLNFYNQEITLSYLKSGEIYNQTTVVGTQYIIRQNNT